jgi:DNA-binding response OmpR family regulator
MIVEDERTLANTLALNLRLEQYSVIVSHSGIDALSKFRDHSSSTGLVLLDVM